MRRSPGTQSYTVDPDSPASAVAAVYRSVMRDRLQVFYIDLLSDSPGLLKRWARWAARRPRAPGNGVGSLDWASWRGYHRRA